MKHTLALLVTGVTLALAALTAGAQPLTLADCTALALKQNPNVVVAAGAVTSAQAGVTSARSSYYPQLALGYGVGLTGLSRSGLGGSTTTTNQLDLGLGMTFYQRGRAQSVAKSQALATQAAANQATTLQGLVEQVATQYYTVLADQELITVAEAGVSSAQTHLAQVKARIRLGAAADVDATTAQADLSAAELQVINTRSNLRLAEAQLRTTLALPAGEPVELAAPTEPASDRAPTLQEALETANRQRPELAAGKASVEATNQALALAKIERGPGVSVVGALNEALDKSDSQSDWSLGVQVSWALWDGHAAKAAETAARANRDSTAATLQSTRNQVALEVENALVEVERTQQQIAATAAAVTSAQAQLAAAEGKYQQGLGILLEVTDARSALTSALADQVQARYGYQLALVTLQQATGTLSTVNM